MANIIRLQSRDLKEFAVDVNVAMQSTVLKDMLTSLEENETTGQENDDLIPISHSDGVVLENVLEWMNHHKDDIFETDCNGNVVISEWDSAFFDKHNEITLKRLLRAANFLDINPLHDMGCQRVARMISGKDAEVIRKFFAIKGDPVVVKLCADNVSHVNLCSCNAVIFQVETHIAELIPKVKSLMMESGVKKGVGKVIPLEKCYSGTIINIVEWVKLHNVKDEITSQVHDNFVREHFVDFGDVFDTLLVAGYLDVQDLENLLVKKVAKVIDGKSPDQVRDMLRIANDSTPKEIRHFELEHKWAD